MKEYIYRDTTKVEISKEKILEMTNYYNECKSLREVSKKFGYNHSTLYRYMKEAGVKIKMDFKLNGERVRKFQIDESYFERIDTKDKAYIFGLLLSDGCMYDSGGLWQVRLKLTDLELLDAVKVAMKYDRPLTINKKEKESHKQCKTLIIANRKIFEDLVKLGCTPRKSFTKTFPTHIPNELMPSFIRGYFDGNGSIYVGTDKRGNCVSEIKIVSSSLFCYSMVDFFANLGVYSYVDFDKRHDNRVADFRIRRFEDINKFQAYIYSDKDNSIFLERKFNKFVELKIRKNI